MQNRLSLWIVVSLGVCASGCLKTVANTRSEKTFQVGLALVHRSVDGTRITAPPAYAAEVRDRLQAAGFSTVEAQLPGADTSTRRALRSLAAQPQVKGVDYLVLVESRSSFYSEIQGRFRWTVNAKISVARTDDLASANDHSFSAPAILLFPHEADRETLDYAAPTLAREIARSTRSFVDDTTQAPAAASKRDSPRPESIYFVMLDRFKNGQRKNDGQISSHPADWHGGDLAGLMAKLDHIADLGVRSIWLSPLYQSKDAKVGEHGAFHGYWVEDHNELEPRFGDASELAALRNEVEKRGMTLILDVVVNHVGYDAPLTRKRPDWFHKNGDIRDWNSPTQLTDNNVHGLPDLAQEKPAVFNYLLASTRSWIKRARPSALRLDAVKHAPRSFWRRFNAALKSESPDLRLIGEVFDGNPIKLAGSLREDGFDHVFDFPLYYAMVDVFCRGHAAHTLAATLSHDRVYPDSSQLLTFADNHDLPRLASACPSKKAQDSLLLFMLTARGIPSLNYGTEVGLTGKGEPENRSDMRFERGPRYALVRNLLTARGRYPALQHGRYLPLEVSENVFAYARVTDDQAAVFIYNRGPGPKRLELGKLAGDAVFSLPKSSTSAAIDIEAQAAKFVVINARSPGDFGQLGRPATSRIRFRAPADTKSGVRLGGGGPELGNWDPQAATPLSAPTEHVIEVPRGTTLVYKLYDLAAQDWEKGANRFIHADRADLLVELSWRK